MTSPLLTDLSGRIAATMRPLAAPATYRVVATFQGKAAAPAAAGATSLRITPPSGMDGVMAGDTFTVGGPTIKAVTVPAPVVDSTITVTFAPPLTAPIAAGAVVPLARSTDTPILAWIEAVEVARLTGTLIGSADVFVNVLAQTLPDEPRPGATILIGGRTLTVKSAQLDGAGAVWRILAGI
ncbi:hypothetical protein CRT60_16420 [Azospirillum palustre]|uniref:Uncharacterized protein n=1 Tax=Azospirillum palustre TaxID=2044885 RepID=A0A2B8BCP0_9PROT|nr:hypothetical protein [Azospirillum palustre]PGH56506.1 hypothetical protein CRT60_16420 [Azospirillum palustre]